MKIAIIHSVNQGFFPRFHTALTQAIRQAGHKSITYLPNVGGNRRNHIPGSRLYGTPFIWFWHYYLHRITTFQDIYSAIDTLHLIHYLNQDKPSIIHFHVVNECKLHWPLLVRWINRHSIPVVWTFHDCRAFTGRCPYFDEIGCEKWKNGCGKCPEKKLYDPTWADSTALQWKIRRHLFTKIKRLHIVTPSQWLADFTKQSFFCNTPCTVIYNGVDTQRFSQKQPDTWKDKYNLHGKKIVLGIAGAWEPRKGLDYLIRLSQELPDEYRVVLVGKLPTLTTGKIINIPPTKDPNLLASIYQHSDVFCNPTLADNFPTTNIEALASGTPVVTFNTGGSPEAIDHTCGITVPKGDFQKLKEAVITVVSSPQKYTPQNCITRSQNFTNKQYSKYVQLYESLIKREQNK
ncbi:MAG: glycosyltransferase [Bacteroidaceae bacterium]|nr:glycosyltransferase [Bacteroidaceae bacterium]